MSIDQDKAFDRAFSAIEKRVKLACKEAGHKRKYVIFSAYEHGEDDLPNDNLDKVAVRGKCVFVQKVNEYWSEDGRDFRSPQMENPTWLEVAVVANAMIRRTRDMHHCFLEGVDKIGEEAGVAVYEFSMGS